MNIAQIESNLQGLSKNIQKETFIYDFLEAYDTKKTTIKRLTDGSMNLSKVRGELSWKKKVFFKEVFGYDLHKMLAAQKDAAKHQQRFIITTDYKTLVALDTKTNEKLDIDLAELPKHFDFFLPLAGMEKTSYQDENPADVKAAEKMAKLFDVIKKENEDDSPEFAHALNVFLSRLLFCFFAEDTNIFTENQFTNSISSHTQADGSDLHDYLDKLFVALDTPVDQRKDSANFLKEFPYVNGGLFRERLATPKFSRRSRQAIIDSGELDWAAINPDIFGSMFQAVIAVDQRSTLGQHYTSVPNIMKVIEPLFLNDLYEAFEKAKGNEKKLNELLHRLRNIKIFDPACGSGNFLIIAYKELRKLEMQIFKESGMMALSGISLSQLYGIEIDDFAAEVAQLALWLAEHQMNVKFFNEFGRTNPTLPLKATGNIVKGNATRLNWELICPKSGENKIYLLGNPPYLGAKLLTKSQKEDTKAVYKGFAKFNNLDYIGCWFVKASNYIDKTVKSAFVSTNSICQGTQVNDLWSNIFNKEIEIQFAVKDFPWSNNAKDKAAVICSIIGLSYKSKNKKFIYFEGIKKEVNNINGYLLNADNIFIERRTLPLSNLPKMIQGNIALDDGLLQLNKQERDFLINESPNSKELIRRVYGSRELINDIDRYCLWIDDSSISLAYSIPFIKDRIDKVRQTRLKGASNAQSCADRPHQFCMVNTSNTTQIILPIVSSERRKYIPMSFKDKEAIVTHAAQVIPNSEPFIFSILNSKMHMAWVRSFAGKLKSDYRYSAGICWHSFPFPNISKTKSEQLSKSAFGILAGRERHSSKTLAQLYDPDKMPQSLKEAHHQNDLAVESCYRSNPFESDEERLEYLFKLYEKMIDEEKAKDTLFAKTKKTKRTKK